MKDCVIQHQGKHSSAVSCSHLGLSPGAGGKSERVHTNKEAHYARPRADIRCAAVQGFQMVFLCPLNLWRNILVYTATSWNDGADNVYVNYSK